MPRPSTRWQEAWSEMTNALQAALMLSGRLAESAGRSAEEAAALRDVVARAVSALHVIRAEEGGSAESS